MIVFQNIIFFKYIKIIFIIYLAKLICIVSQFHLFVIVSFRLV